MSAISRFLVLTGMALGPAACSSDEQTSFSNACVGDAAAAPGCGGTAGGAGASAGGGSAGVVNAGGTPSTGGLGGSGGMIANGGAAGTGGASGGAGGASGGAGAGGQSPDAGGPPPVCVVTGGGPTLTPPGSCTVLAYCGRTEFRLVCRIGGPTCDCRTKGVTLKTIPNSRDFCAQSDAGARTNVDEANAACGWNLDTSTFNP